MDYVEEECRMGPGKPGGELYTKCIESPNVCLEVGQKCDSNHFSNKL